MISRIHNMQTQELSFICFSTAHWDAELWTNRQRIMNILSDDYKVLFVDPGLHSKKYTRKILTEKPGRVSPLRWLRKEKEKLWVYSPQLLPLYRLSPFVQKMAWRVVIMQLRLFCRRFGFNKPVLWLYSPEATAVLGHLDESLVVYDCVDNYVATPYYARSAGRAQRFMVLETNLLKRADVVATTSKTLWEEKRRYNPNTYLTPNVGDVVHFRKATLPETVIADDILHIPHPVIGFVGAVNQHKVDFELVKYIAQTQPDWSIVLIGPVGGWGDQTDTTSLMSFPNIYLLGSKPYVVLPSYIKAFDVCIIPYGLNEYTKDVFPLKFFEFLASEKPVVTTALPALLEYNSIVGVAHTYQEFVQHVKAALLDPDENLAERRKVASEHTWEHRASQLLAAVQDRLDAKNT
jgi:glycosyltransferase involved in cell wall biosynthesis